MVREKTDKEIECEAKEAKQRQINYYVMRYMWQAIRGRSSDDIYSFLGISRQRFTRALNGLNMRISEEDETKLKKRTDLDIRILSGKIGFDINSAGFNYYAEQVASAKMEHAGILLDKKQEDNKSNKGSDKFSNNYTNDEFNNICEQLEKAILNSWNTIKEKVETEKKVVEPSQFYILCYNIYHNKHFVGLNPIDAITSVIDELSSVTSSANLEKCKLSDLKGICESILSIYSKANIVYSYQLLKSQNK